MSLTHEEKQATLERGKNVLDEGEVVWGKPDTDEW